MFTWVKEFELSAFVSDPPAIRERSNLSPRLSARICRRSDKLEICMPKYVQKLFNEIEVPSRTSLLYAARLSKAILEESYSSPVKLFHREGSLHNYLKSPFQKENFLKFSGDCLIFKCSAVFGRRPWTSFWLQIVKLIAVHGLLNVFELYPSQHLLSDHQQVAYVWWMFGECSVNVRPEMMLRASCYFWFSCIFIKTSQNSSVINHLQRTGRLGNT